ncbi:hypothetical protein B566_EDAN006163 [Ephemera danica]|nr:hypothetical protein B566_EDAN006163 [Ephemera danica]
MTTTVFVPWNQIVVVPSIVMQLTEEGGTGYRARKGGKSSKVQTPVEPQTAASSQLQPTLPTRYSPPCAEHDHRLMRPVVVSTWMPEKVGGAPGRSRVFSETQILQESIPIPGSNVHLMYHSSQAPGYLSTALMRLTHAHIPETLRLVHLRVVIEGSVYERTFEADPHLSYTFAWNKRNVYKQKVYGVATARVSVGYEYTSCASIVWETQTVAMQGFDVDISDVGGWSLDIHHHYNFHEGVLQKGDGSTLHFKQYPRTVGVVLGTGIQREPNCGDECNGAAKDARLLTPVALASGPDGSLYVGDFNLIRRVTPEGNVYTVLKFSNIQVSFNQYYLSVSPADGHLYVSDPEKHQILRLLQLEDITDPSINSEPAVGSGERCIPGDETHCGDEGPAKDAKLAHPKDTRGIIHTLVGHHGHHNHWKPIPCHGAIPAQQAQLQWPTGLALSPLDGSLYFIDDHLVLKLTDDLKVKVVAGTPLHCPLPRTGTEERDMEMSNEEEATSTVLGSILSLSFSPIGDLYIAETDSRKVNAIRVIDPSGRISDFAGRQATPRCECPQQKGNNFFNTTCSCPTAHSTVAAAPSTAATETMLSSNAQFDSISAMAVSPDGVLHVADQGSLHILSLQHYLPSPDENGDYQIPYPPTREIYTFNRYGQHVATRDLTSGKVRYSFLYSKNTSFGKLSTVTDGSGNKLMFLRDYSNIVSTIETTQDHKSDLKISGVGFLTKLIHEKGRAEIDLDYDSITGLLTSKSDTKGNTFIYRDVIVPTGETVSLGFRLLPDDGVLVNVARNGLEPAELRMRGSSQGLEIREGGSVSEARALSNGSSWVRAGWGAWLRSETGVHHPLLELALPVEAQMLPLAGAQRLTVGDGLTNLMECRYRLVGDAKDRQQRLERELWVNSSRVLAVEFDQAASRETYYDREHVPLLAVHYDTAGLPLSWMPASPGQPVNITYDRFKRIEGWSWGEHTEHYAYERHGLLAEVTAADDGSTQFTYNDWNLVARITMPSGRRFTFQYDEQGGLRQVTLPSETRHVFSAQQSFGFVRLSYTPPGSTRSYLQHLSHSGQLLQTVFPGDGARVLYRYDSAGRLCEILHGDGRTQINYSRNGFPSEVLQSERDDFEYRRDMQYVRGLLSEERLDFGAKTGLSNAKFTYEYDANLRLTSVQGRIAGQTLPDFARAYSSRTGAPELLGQFKLSQPKSNETSVFDGTALFTRHTDGRFRETQTRTFTRNNVGVNMYTNTKNFTYDPDGQLRGVEAQEPWSFRYDDNGNMLSLTYRGNVIPMEYNALDRIVKFGEGAYRYDNRGLVVQNARDERFHYNSKGLLVRATKRGRFDVRYYYDHMDRLATRKDNYGNVTQFFYTNQERLHEVSHIYSPRDGKLMSLVYDDRGHLIFAQVYRHKYYVATDQCGTPVMVFNQYGEGVREIMRSPFGHIVYDSNPYLYLPIDFCGGLLDQVTSLVHMPGSGGGVYDPLIGQWMTPRWEGVLDRVSTPSHLHLYRFNGNDPINARRAPDADIAVPAGARKLLSGTLAPQLFPEEVTGFPASKSALLESWPAPPVQPPLLSSTTSLPGSSRPMHASAGFLSHLAERRMQADSLSSLLRSAVKHDVWPAASIRVSTADPPFGRGILVSRVGQQAVVSSVPAANNIYRDVFTSVFNQSLMLDFTFLVHTQDVFYFVKEDVWRSTEDHGQLKRLGGQVNLTFHEKDSSTEGVAGGGGKVIDLKIHSPSAVVNLRYGTTASREKQRLLHHARGMAIRKAWHREKDLLKSGFPGSMDWSAAESEEILQSGSAAAYDAEYVHDVQKYPELAEDPFNVRFYKKSERSTSGRRKRDSSNSAASAAQASTWSPTSPLRTCSTHWWLPWRHDAC